MIGELSRAAPREGSCDRGRPILARLRTQIDQWWCGLHGHTPLMRFEGERIFLRCSSCGWDSVGWTLDGTRPRVRFGKER